VGPGSTDGKFGSGDNGAQGGGSYILRVTDLRILVVEDDQPIGRGLVTAFEGQGYAVTWVERGGAALEQCQRADFDLLLLDIGLPDIDGIEVCRRLRSAGNRSRIVMLTARADETDVIAGLGAGADDYLTKPFRLAELLARVHAHLRRDRLESGPSVDRLLEVGDLRVDPSARRVHVAGREVELRPREFDLLILLVQEAGRALTRERIMSGVWDEHWFGSTKTLDMHISALRRKLGDPPPVTITTLRGVGYRLELP